MTNTFPIEIRHNDTLISFTVKPGENELTKYYEVWRHGELYFRLDDYFNDGKEGLRLAADFADAEIDPLLVAKVAEIIGLEE